MKKDKKDKLPYSRIFKNNTYMLKRAMKICPGRVWFSLLSHAFMYGSWMFYSVIFLRYIFATIHEENSFSKLSTFVIVAMLLFMLTQLFQSWYNLRYSRLKSQEIYEKLNDELFIKAREVELSCYENPEFYDSYTLAIKEASGRMEQVINNMSGAISGIIAVAVVYVTLASIDIYLLLFSLFPITGAFVFGKIVNKLKFKRDQEQNIPRRKKDYVNRTVYLATFAKEIRLSKVFRPLADKYNAGYDNIIRIVKKYMTKLFVFESIDRFFKYIFIMEGVMFYAVYRTLVTETMSIKNFIVVLGATWSATSTLIDLSYYMNGFFENGMYIQNMRKFLEYEPAVPESQDGILPLKDMPCLELNNLSFTYQGSEQEVLSNINIKINPGEKVAFVGHNGAGKSTLVKLITRLYDPTDGEVCLNGVCIKEYNLKAYRNIFGTVFQDYQVFSMTVAENVLAKDVETEEERERVFEALKSAGVYDKVMSLPNKENTVLTREFDDEGAVLSGGETQKIAIARLYAKDFEIAILDEPTSALDPIAEYEMYENMMRVCENKSVIFISHRLSSAILADRVYMFENGKIIEQGSQMELMEADGKYADMYRKQAEKYVEKLEVPA